MATKEQERKALARIRKIVAELGEDSYLATAFDGTWELAESNIENDFANSTRWYIDQYHKACEQSAENSINLTNKVKELTAEVEFQKGEAEFHKKAYVEKNKDYNGACEKIEELVKARKDAEERVEALELETMKLKAKLYDLMTK